MDSCKQYKNLIKKLQANNLSNDEIAELKNHCMNCPDCNALLSLHNELSESEEPVLLPSASEFTQVRQAVLRRIRQSENKVPDSIVNRLISLLQKPSLAYGFALACLIAGILIGLNLTKGSGNESRALVQQMEYVAVQNSSIKQVGDSPYTFSNVTVENTANDMLRLNFNVSTHIELVRPKSDPLVKEVLAQSLINPEPRAYRIRNMNYVEKIIDPKIKEALIFSLKNDPAMPVRLKALIILLKYKNDEDIQSAFLDVVRQEESVQMRLLAIDYLTENNIDAALLNEAAESSSLELKAPVLVKTRQYGETNTHF